MLRTTCLVKALVAAGFTLVETSPYFEFKSNASWGSDEGVEGRFGDPAFVRYPGGCSSVERYVGSCSSLNRDRVSLRSAFSHDVFECVHFTSLLRIHLPVSRPGSRRCFFSSWVSSRNKIPITTPHATITVQTRFGRRYGNLSQMVPGANICG